MEIGRVVGQVVSTVKHQGLSSLKLLVLEPAEAAGELGDLGPRYIAVDLVGAGNGEIVLVTRGSSARAASEGGQVPTDAAVVAILDSVVVDGSTTFRKGG